MKVIKWIISGIFCHLLYRVKYINLEKLDNKKKCILCPNHSHILDPTWIYPKIENLSIMAKSEIFKNKWIAKVLIHFNVFPVNREKKDAGSVLHSMDILKGKHNRKLLIFPEGAVIKKDKEKGKVKNGAVFIAAETQTPIMPIYITKNPKLFSTITVTFGDYIIVSKEILKEKEKIKETSEKLLDKIYQLS